MPTLPDFKLETHFQKWEFKSKYHMTASDAESMSMKDLLAMASPEDRDGFENLWLGYTQTYGAPDLLEVIAGMYASRTSEEILCFCGASEGIYAANNVILDKDSHAIAITPNYQSHETLPASICEISGVALDPPKNDSTDPADNWSLDVDKIKAAIRPNTKLLTINFPHNPTGCIPSDDTYSALIDLCRHHGIYIFSDEIFKGLGRTGARHLPYITDVYERGLSLNVTSKAFGLPGLRVGWIACADKELLSKMERMKHYLSICNSAPSERLALIAMKNRETIVARNCKVIDENLVTLNAFFERHTNLFDWKVSDGSCMAFPRYKGEDGVEVFCQRLVEESGVFLLPSSIYDSTLTPTPKDRFRIGFGRRNISEGLKVMDEHIARVYA